MAVSVDKLAPSLNTGFGLEHRREAKSGIRADSCPRRHGRKKRRSWYGRDSGGFVSAEAQRKTDGRIRAYLGQIHAR